jgi:hypothetical protein
MPLPSWPDASGVGTLLPIGRSRRTRPNPVQTVAASARLNQALELMNELIAVLAIAILVSSCSRQSALPQLQPGPFVGVDVSELSARDGQIIKEASEDFRAVVQGKKPIHAKFDKNAPLPSDGGTHFYKGDGYELTISISLSSFGEFNGTAYGPILTFDEKFAPGNTNKISDIRVYSNEELRKFLLN